MTGLGMRVRRSTIGIVAIFAVIVLVGCSAPTSPSPGSHQLLQAIDPPPSAPPTAEANGVVLPIAQYEWWNDGKWTRHLVTDPSSVTITDVPVSGDAVAVTFDSAVRPSQMVVSVFDQVDAQGLPTSATGTVLDCSKGQRCSATVLGTEMTLTIRRLAAVKVIVLRFAYTHAGPPDSSGSPTAPITLSASWALRITSKTQG